ncbi:MAG: imidazole glycerol phosphate synthase subunit HisH [bacterium]|nr:imidazole glycerol phosphate synthase subunit HisH [bacterium]
MKIAIIDYKSSNIGSVTNALKRLNFDYIVTNNPQEILRADKVILPGVGRAGQAMNELRALGLDLVLKDLKVPFLGICLGMQLMLDSSEEDSGACLGIISGTVRKLPDTVRVPKIGWNGIDITAKSPLLEGISKENAFYFVHSFFCDTDSKYTLAYAEYGVRFPTVINRDNFYGVQFHPEKSGDDGEKLLNNFLNL